MAKFIEGTGDPLIHIVKTDAGQQVHGLMSWDQILNRSGTTGDINEEHKRVLDKMKMHEKLFRQQDNLSSVDIERGHKW